MKPESQTIELLSPADRLYARIVNFAIASTPEEERKLVLLSPLAATLNRLAHPTVEDNRLPLPFDIEADGILEEVCQNVAKSWLLTDPESSCAKLVKQLGLNAVLSTHQQLVSEMLKL